MSDFDFAELDLENLPFEADIIDANAVGTLVGSNVHPEDDVRRAVLEIGEDAFFGPDEIRFPRPDVPPETRYVYLLELHPQSFTKEFAAATKYVRSRYHALSAGKEFRVETSMARECGRYRTRWPTFLHFLLSPTPPIYLRCAVCMKRIPVGADIRTIPERKAQPRIVDMQGRPMQLSGNILTGSIPTIDTRQQCVAEDCPLKNDHPHSVGLLSYSAFSPSMGFASWIPSRLGRAPLNFLPSVPVTYNPRTSLRDEDQFWGGNSEIPLEIREWTTVIIREELVWRWGDSLEIEAFRKRYHRDRTDKMRAYINAFRAYHCFYRPLHTDAGLATSTSNMQEDIISEYLRLGSPGSKPWVERFLRGLTHVAVHELATDDKECGICKGVYEEDISSNGITPESAVKLPFCGHVLGRECMRQVLTTKDEGGSGMRHCPLCRGVIYEDDTSLTSTAEAVNSAPLDLGFEISDVSTVEVVDSAPLDLGFEI